jgi:hypothetical protein
MTLSKTYITSFEFDVSNCYLINCSEKLILQGLQDGVLEYLQNLEVITSKDEDAQIVANCSNKVKYGKRSVVYTEGPSQIVGPFSDIRSVVQWHPMTEYPKNMGDDVLVTIEIESSLHRFVRSGKYAGGGYYNADGINHLLTGDISGSMTFHVVAWAYGPEAYKG